MKAGILKKKLRNIPDDATVIVENDSCYEDGDYIATRVKYWKEENKVRIETGHGKKVND